MEKLFFIFLFVLLSNPIYSQNIAGDWHGVLDAQVTQLRLVFHIEETDSGYAATFDSPDQGAEGLLFTSVSFDNPDLRLAADNMQAVYTGRLTADSLIGTWSQAGMSFTLNMSRNEVKKEQRNRPQEPQKPYPYYEEEVLFPNEKDSLTLAGTLTLPEEQGQFPAVILISGSGPQNRNEELYGHKPFLVLADHLTRHGIAVLRYDDRGTAESTGNYSSATFEEFTRDALSAVDYLKSRDEIDPNNIGLIGHSEGGVIAPMAANRDSDVAFIVMLAGPGIPGKEISLIQVQTLRDVDVPDEEAFLQFVEEALEIASADKELALRRKELTAHYRNSEVLTSIVPEGVDHGVFIERQVANSLRPWAQYYYNHDPAKELRQLSVPALSLIGSNDLQVPVEVNHQTIRKALQAGGNKDFTVKELKGLNHMFQESETGRMSEYPEIEQTFSPVALEEITKWILRHLNQDDN